LLKWITGGKTVGVMRRPLHIAVAQGDMTVIDQLLSIMATIKSPVDQFNRQRQVRTWWLAAFWLANTCVNETIRICKLLMSDQIT